MRSRAALAALIAFVVGVVAVVAGAAADRRDLAFSLSVRAAEPGVILAPGHEACQRRIEVEAPFGGAALLLATFHQPGPRLAARVSDARTGRTIATGVLPDGYPDGKLSTIPLDPEVGTGPRVDLCVRNAGRVRVALFGGPGSDNLPSHATVDGRPIASDLVLELRRRHARSALSLVPDVFRRASLFHPSWVGAWTFWLLAALVLVGVPALLVRAVRAAERAG